MGLKEQDTDMKKKTTTLYSITIEYSDHGTNKLDTKFKLHLKKLQKYPPLVVLGKLACFERQKYQVQM